MEPRKKASDVFNETNYVFGKKVRFGEAFPEIEDLRVEVTEEGRDIIGSSGKSIYTKEYFPGEFINCSNSSCYNGGFSIGSILREMEKNKQTEFETRKGCQGNEGSPKGKRIYRKCLNSFQIKVSIKYREDQSKSS
jgi:hypothetical protein